MDILGPGPLGAPGPRCRIRVATVTTYCQAGFQPYETCTQLPHTCTQTFPHTDYLLSGKATYYQASYLLSGKLPTVRHAPKRSRILCTQQPHTCTQPIHRDAPKRHRHAPKRRRHAPKSIHILCTQQPHTFLNYTSVKSHI